MGTFVYAKGVRQTLGPSLQRHDSGLALPGPLLACERAPRTT